jgi:YD repeat-containing protein
MASQSLFLLEMAALMREKDLAGTSKSPSDCATKNEFLFANGSTTVRGTKNKRAPPMNKKIAALPALASMSHASMPSDRHLPARMSSRTVLAVFLFGVALAAHAGSVNHTYDALGRLASTVYSNGTSTTTITYSFDAAGNRTSVVTTSP